MALQRAVDGTSMIFVRSKRGFSNIHHKNPLFYPRPSIIAPHENGSGSFFFGDCSW